MKWVDWRQRLWRCWYLMLLSAVMMTRRISPRICQHSTTSHCQQTNVWQLANKFWEWTTWTLWLSHTLPGTAEYHIAVRLVYQACLWHVDKFKHFFRFDITGTVQWLPNELSARISCAWHQSNCRQIADMNVVYFVHEISAQCWWHWSALVVI